eukprot:Rmarinus@m.9085
MEPETEDCRYCREEANVDDLGQLYAVCDCRSVVHLQCLTKWVKARQSRTNVDNEDALNEESLVCEVCQQPYRIKYGREVVCDPKMYCSARSCGNYLECCVIIFMLFCLSSLPFLFINADTDSTEKMVFLICSGVLIVCVFLTLRKIYSRWVLANSVPVLRPLPSATPGASSASYHANVQPAVSTFASAPDPRHVDVTIPVGTYAPVPVSAAADLCVPMEPSYLSASSPTIAHVPSSSTPPQSGAYPLSPLARDPTLLTTPTYATSSSPTAGFGTSASGISAQTSVASHVSNSSTVHG